MIGWRKSITNLAVAVLTGACVSYPPPPEQTHSPVLLSDAIVASDGAHLPVSVWQAKASGNASEAPSAVIVALHGMNDYAHAFALAGAWWAEHAQITTYALDQRGFGRGKPDDPRISIARWPGAPALRADLRAAVKAIKAAHPETPLYLVGHSMGGAVILSAAAEAPLGVEGVILAAPAVWGGSQLPLPYRLSANIGAAFAPAKTLTGARAGRQATDNIEILYAMGRDSHIIKETRIDAVLGVVRLMGEAYDATKKSGGDILFLYGKKDEIIPDKPIARAVRRLCGDIELRIYEEGWHLLFRDLQAETVWRDVANWIAEKNAAGSGKGMAPAAFVCSDAEEILASDVAAPRALAKGRQMGE